MSSVFSIYGKMQESGLTEIIPLTCTSAIWGQDPVLCQAGWCTTGEAAAAAPPPCADTAGNHFSSTGSSWHPVGGGQGCCPTSDTTEASPKKRTVWLKALSAVEKPSLPDVLRSACLIFYKTFINDCRYPVHQLSASPSLPRCTRVCSVTSDTLESHIHEAMDPITSVHGPHDLLGPWDSPGKNTGVGCHALLQGIFPAQGSNPHLLHWQADSLPPSHLESPPPPRWVLHKDEMLVLFHY